MVSGLVTSPCDQLRIFSGEARLIRMASKSAIGFPRSKGLERYKVVLRFLRLYAAACGSQFSSQLPVLNSQLKTALIHSCFAAVKSALQRSLIFLILCLIPRSQLSSASTENRERRTENWVFQSAAAAATGFLSVTLISSTSRHSDCNSRIRTLNDSGTPGSMAASPFTMAS